MKRASSRTKPKYTAILSLTSTDLTAAQMHVETALDEHAKRWKLDEVVTNDSKPSELFYLVRLRKSDTKDTLITSIRKLAGTSVGEVTFEEGEAAEQDKLAQKTEQKLHEKALAQ